MGSAAYFDVCSFPDLFHFNQGLARSAGAYIGKAWRKAVKDYKAIQQAGVYYSQQKPFEDRYLWQASCRKGYQDGIHAIHKAIHAFDNSGNWKALHQIKLEIQQAILH